MGARRIRRQREQPVVLRLREHGAEDRHVVQRIGVARFAGQHLPESLVGGFEPAAGGFRARQHDLGAGVGGQAARRCRDRAMAP